MICEWQESSWLSLVSLTRCLVTSCCLNRAAALPKVCDGKVQRKLIVGNVSYSLIHYYLSAVLHLPGPVATEKRVVKSNHGRCYGPDCNLNSHSSYEWWGEVYFFWGERGAEILFSDFFFFLRRCIGQHWSRGKPCLYPISASALEQT